jgi:hypothetical protein
VQGINQPTDDSVRAYVGKKFPRSANILDPIFQQAGVKVRKPARRQTPAQTTPTTSAQTTPATTQVPLAASATFKGNLLNEDQWWVMAAIDNALRITQRRTPERKETIAMLQAMPHDPRIVDKIPQLTQIQRENHAKVFNLAVFLVENHINKKSDLVDAYYRIVCEATMLNKNQINQIFLGLARQGVTAPQRPASTQTYTSSPNAAPQAQQAQTQRVARPQPIQPPQAQPWQTQSIMDKRITPDSLATALQSNQGQVSPTDWRALSSIPIGTAATLKDVVGELKTQNASIGLMPVLLAAVGST